jgi:hypothetical protein
MAVNAGVKVGFALGCETADDIRLHYSAVSEYIIKSNGKKKPNNSNGSKVELMICDIQSYAVAMFYMLSFFKKQNIILVMDEPTITMDYMEHELHKQITNIWDVNQIEQIILSSATLPNQNELGILIEKFIKYSSNKNDTVLDCFCGGFTTGRTALRCGRNFIGFELNKNAFDVFYPTLKNIKVEKETPPIDPDPIVLEKRKKLRDGWRKKRKERSIK